MRFSPYKDSLCPTVSPRDGLHSPLRKGGEGGRKGRKRERMSERGREGGREEVEWRAAAVKDMAA